MKIKWAWDKALAALILCALFFLATFSLYSMIPREYLAERTAGPETVLEPFFVEREIIQTIPVNHPVAGLTLFFSSTEDNCSDDVHVEIVGQESGRIYYDGAIPVPELSENEAFSLPFLQTAEAGQDAHLTVTVTAGGSNGFAVLCSEDETIPYGSLTVDGSLLEGSLVFQPSLLREYWTWQRTAPLPYFILCLLMIKLFFSGMAWYEKRSGKKVSLPREEAWWLQAMCGGFLLISGVFFTGSAIKLGMVCANPNNMSQLRQISAFSQTAMALMYLAVIGLVSYIAVKTPPMERVAAVSVLAIGMIYMAAITPLSPPDEGHHYQSAYSLSNYLLFQWENLEMGNASHFDYAGLTSHANVSSAYLRIMDQWNQPGMKDALVQIPTPRSLSYPIEMIPQAIGLTLGRLLNLNFLGVFYLGRLTNLFFFAVCVYFAVKRIPRFKELMTLTALLPMTLQQAASYSYDAFINGMAFLFIASLIREYAAEGKMSRKDFLWLLIPGALLTPAKAVYSALLFLALLIPTRRFGSGKRKWGMTAFAAVICLGMLIAVNFPSLYNRILSASSGYELQSSMGYSLYTVSFILEHPGETGRIFLNTLSSFFPMWMIGCIGWALSGLSLTIPMEYVYGFALLLIAAVVYRKPGEAKITVGQRAAFVGCFAVVVLLTMLALFTGWTPVGDSVVQGVQGRYFLPVLPLLCMAVSGNFKWKRIRIEKLLLCAAWILNVQTILWVFARTAA